MKINGNDVGSNSNLYNYIPKDSDLVSCVMTSHYACPTGNPATSNTDTMIFLQPLRIITQPVNLAVCDSSEGLFIVQAAGAGPISYQWQINKGSGVFTNITGVLYKGFNKDSLMVLNASLSQTGYLYRCIITGPCSTDTSDQVTLTIHTLPVPQITSTGTLYTCSNDSIILSTLLTYSSYPWSNGQTSAVTYVDTPGKYSVIVKDINHCSGTSSDYTVVDSIIPVTQICIVTVDPNTNKNMVVWEKNKYDFTAGYYILRQLSLSTYDTLGFSPYDSLSVFIDTASRPVVLYPNPFSTVATLEYELKNTSDVQIELFDNMGINIKELQNASLNTGVYKLTITDEDLNSSGLYYIRLIADNQVSTLKLWFLKPGN